jgi:hypothetical protein
MKRKTSGAPPGTRIAFPARVNRLSERQGGNDTLVPVDPERHALQVRIEHSKERIVEDLQRASALVRGAAARAGRGLGTIFVVAGLAIAAAIVAALVQRRRRVRITWR